MASWHDTILKPVGNMSIVRIVCLLLWSAAAFADTPATYPAVVGALRALDATRLDEDWAFTMDLVENGVLHVIESDPAREPYERRRLVSVDGVAPDESRLAKFRKAERSRIDEIDPDTEGYEYLVDLSTLQEVGAQGEHTAFTFAPRVKDMEKARDKLRGTLLLNNATGQVDRLEIGNTGTLDPAFSVTVDTYRLELAFVGEQGEQLLRTLESRAVGKAGFLKSFDSKVEITFRDYRRAP